MNTRRKSLLVVLLVLLALPLVGAGMGSVEVAIWLVLLAAWVVAFATWGGHAHGSDHAT